MKALLKVSAVKEDGWHCLLLIPFFEFFGFYGFIQIAQSSALEGYRAFSLIAAGIVVIGCAFRGVSSQISRAGLAGIVIALSLIITALHEVLRFFYIGLRKDMVYLSDVWIKSVLVFFILLLVNHFFLFFFVYYFKKILIGTK